MDGQTGGWRHVEKAECRQDIRLTPSPCPQFLTGSVTLIRKGTDCQPQIWTETLKTRAPGARTRPFEMDRFLPGAEVSW